MHAQYSLFQQGYNLLDEIDPYMKKLAAEVSRSFFFFISMKPELHQLSCMTSTWTIDQRWLCNLPIKTELMLRSSTNTRAEVSPEVQSVFVYSSLTLWTLSVTVYEEFILYYYFCLNFPLFGLIDSWISWWSTQPWRRGKWSTNTPPFSRGWVHTF